MNIVKWIRKNERKIMAWVVILIMISFVGGYGFQQFLENFGQGGSKQAVATWGEDGKIRIVDLQNAQTDLEILRRLGADQYLFQYSSGGGNLLGLILFPEAGLSGQMRMQLVRAAQEGRMPIKVEQIDEFFASTPHRPDVLWHLLVTEAHNAGCAVSVQSASSLLSRLVPALSQNQVDAAFLVRNIVEQSNIPEERILQTFANLLAVLTYSDMVTQTYSVTTQDVRQAVARNLEKLSADFVLLEAESFSDPEFKPQPQAAAEQFEKFREFLPGVYTEENPYGFGYRIPERVRLEYFLVNMNDVRSRIDKPTAEELEQFYSRNISRYTTSRPTDPNNPDSERITEVQPFAKVAFRVRNDIENQRTEDLAAMLLNEARQKTEAGFDQVDWEKVSPELLQQAAGDYAAAAKELSEKYKVDIYTGRTGQLVPSDFANDSVLARMGLQTAEGTFVRLSDLAYLIPPDGKPLNQPGMPSLRIWENIGPMDTSYYSEKNEKFVPLRALVRVTGINKTEVPESIETTFENTGAAFEDYGQASTFSVQDQVIEDLKDLQAMDAARKQADALMQFVKKDGWESGFEQFKNEYYPGADPNSPASDVPRTESLTEQTVPSYSQIEMLKRSSLRNPRMQNYLQSSILLRRLYEQIASDASQSDQTVVMTFEPGRAVYVIDKLVKEPATEKDYQDMKNQAAVQLAMIAGIEPGLVHFGPNNIAERLNLAYLRTQEEPEEETQQEAPQAEQPQESES